MTLNTRSKLLCILFGTLLLYQQAIGDPILESRSLEQQLAAYIRYPPMLGKNNASVISVSFSVDHKGFITRVQPHSRIQALNNYLVRCLYGKKLRLPGQQQTQTYLVRLRFRPGTGQ